MGIFSLFGKKDAQTATPDERSAARTRERAPSQRPSGAHGAARAPAVRRDSEAALATALKIDAIESEMSSEFVSIQHQPKNPAATARASASARQAAARQAEAKPEAAPGVTLQPLSLTGTTTGLLLGGDSTVEDIAGLSSEAAAVIEEAAIMYANGQQELVEQMLRGAIDEDLLGEVTQKAWQMLFDLYQITGKQQEFDRLSIAFANKFEMSPPAWKDTAAGERRGKESAGAVPIVPFAGRIDAGSQRQMDRIRKLAETQRALRLEFGRVTGIDAEGCGLLLDVLTTLQKSGHELVLVGAAELADRIRAIIEVGRRDDGENAWLLLLEILRLLNRETEFEEASIDYCVTFEVSPPTFVAPRSGVTADSAPSAEPSPEPESFMMPALVENQVDKLVLAIVAYSDEHELAVVDCSQLVRVDFQAAGRMLTGLSPFCGNGKQIEFHHVNHLVAALFDVIGLGDIVRILPRKS